MKTLQQWYWNFEVGKIGKFGKKKAIHQIFTSHLKNQLWLNMEAVMELIH